MLVTSWPYHRVLLSGVLAAIIMFADRSFGQASSRPQGTAAIQVDGAVNPSQIPDELAFLHFFQILLKRSDSRDPIADEQRRKSYSRHYFSVACGATNRTLSEGQIERLLGAVDKATPQFVATHARMIASKGQAEYDSAYRALQTLAAITFNTLDSQDSDLSIKVRDHVRQHVKSRIIIVSAKIPQR